MNLTSNQIRKLSLESRDALFGKHPSSNANPATVSHSVRPIVCSTSKPLVSRPSVALHNGLRILKSQCQHEMPFLFRREAAQVAGIKGVGTLLKAERALLEAGHIKVLSLPEFRIEKHLWEILPVGYDALGVEEPSWKSKGGYLHKFCAYRIANTYRERGYKTDIEYRCGNEKLVDLRAHIPGCDIFVEVCASRPLEKELSNIELDLQVTPFPDELLIVVTERRMRETLIQLIDERFGNCRLPSQVRVLLAGDFINSLRIFP